MDKSDYEPIRSWEEVFEAIDRVVADPAGRTELIKALTINLRVETGSLPGYQGSGFAEKADSIAISKQMRDKLEALMSVDLSQDDLYLLVRQLVKSLPFFGASQDEIRTLRGMAEEIEYAFPCPITEDIRGEIHSKLSPLNLDLVRALLGYVERGDPEPLQKINKYQKVFQYGPDKFRGILGLLRELDRQLANVFEPHPGQIADRLEDVDQFLSNISQIVSPAVNSQLRYLLSSIANRNPSLIQTNIEILLNLLDGVIQGAEEATSRALFVRLREKLSAAGSRDSEAITALITEWRRDGVTFFFPGLIHSLDRLVGYLDARDSVHATLMLGDIRMSLRQKIVDSWPHSEANAVTLEAIWLDLALERIGYILFGEVSHVLLADIHAGTFPTAIDVLRSMILSVRAKGQGTRRLDAYDVELAAVGRSARLNFYAVYAVLERIHEEITAIIDKTIETYYPVTQKIFSLRRVPNAEEAASAFVDGLFRSTTLQHLSELILKLLDFSRSRINEPMKGVRQSAIREISPTKVLRMQRDLETIEAGVVPLKPVYYFRPGFADGSMEDYPILGEKGAYLAEIARLGIPVPPGFTFTSKVCNAFFSDGCVICDETRALLFSCLRELEGVTGRLLGSAERPLLLAVRSGSCFSMPGMMDTILNVGLNRETTEGLSRMTGDPRFAYECYYRLILKYSASVLGLSLAAEEPSACSAGEMKERVEDLLRAVAVAAGKPFPQDPAEQLISSLEAIFSSWRSESAVAYRQIFNVPDPFGTAATVQQMVFGNLGQKSCSGVAFSRNPFTGERRLFGEYLPQSQGEVLACGQGKPLPLSAGEWDRFSRLSLETRYPELYWELEGVARKIERRLGDMQDIEFTVENNTLYVLQTRPAKRMSHAALQVAIDLVGEGIIDRREAVERVDEVGLKELLLPVFSPSAQKQLVAKGNPASPGVASGRLAFERRDAIRRAEAGEDIIFVADRTTPNDIGSIAVSRGVLTREGGITSHAAINSRRMAKPCVTGCEPLRIDKETEILRVDSFELGPGDALSIDGYTGDVFLGPVEIVEPERPQAGSDKEPPGFERYLNTYLEWKKELPGRDPIDPKEKDQ